MEQKVKASTVTLPGETMKKLRKISAIRFKSGDLAWSHKNILVGYIDKEYKEEIKK